MGIHPLADIYSLISFVRGEIQAVHEELGAFVKTIDLNMRLEPHENETYFIKLDPPPFAPDTISYRVRHVMTDLRAALDHLAYACAAEVRTNPKQAGFPFPRAKKDIDGIRKRGSRHLPDAVFEKMISYRPYGDEDENKLLHALNEIRNANLHKFSVQTSGNILARRINIKTITKMLDPKPIIGAPVFYDNPLYFPSERAYAIGLIDPRFMFIENGMELKYGFDMAASSVLPSMPVPGVLYDTANLVEKITTEVYQLALHDGLFKESHQSSQSDTSEVWHTASVFSQR